VDILSIPATSPKPPFPTRIIPPSSAFTSRPHNPHLHPPRRAPPYSKHPSAVKHATKSQKRSINDSHPTSPSRARSSMWVVQYLALAFSPNRRRERCCFRAGGVLHGCQREGSGRCFPGSFGLLVARIGLRGKMLEASASTWSLCFGLFRLRLCYVSTSFWWMSAMLFGNRENRM